MFIIFDCTYCEHKDRWHRVVFPNCGAGNPGVAGSANKGNGW